MTAGFFGRTVKINQLNDVDDSSRSTDSILRFDGTKYKAVANTLKNLSDFNTSNLSDGDVPKYNATSGDFEPGSAGGATQEMQNVLNKRFERSPGDRPFEFWSLAYATLNNRPKVFFCENDGFDLDVHQVDVITGHIDWQNSVGASVVSATADANNVYINADDGNTYALSTSDGTQVWSYTNGSASPPVQMMLGNASGTDVVFVADNNVPEMEALKRSDGTQVWSYGTPTTIKSGLVNRDVGGTDSLYFGDFNGNIHRVNADDGTQLFQVTVAGDSIKTALSFGSPGGTDSIFFGSNDDNLYSIDPTDGSTRWSYASDESQPKGVEYGSGIVVGSETGDVIGVDAATGTKQWTVAASGPSAMKHVGPYIGVFVVSNTGDNEVIGITQDGKKVFTSSFSSQTQTQILGAESGEGWEVYFGNNDQLFSCLSRLPIGLHTALGEV